MAMLIAWQSINAVRHPNSPRFTRGFLVVTPGITIRGWRLTSPQYAVPRLSWQRVYQSRAEPVGPKEKI